MIWRLAGLAVPVLAGLAWLALAGAPTTYLAVNAGALALGLLLILLGAKVRVSEKPLGIILVALLFAPFVFGPVIDGAMRWLPLGPVSFTTSLLTLPALAILFTRARRGWLVAPLVLTFLAGLLQPDGSILLALAAIVLAYGGMHLVALVKSALVAFLAMGMILRDQVEPVEFVEGVLAEAMRLQPLMAVGLAIATLAGWYAIWRIAAAPWVERATLIACLGAFALASLMAAFPTPLLGYGASPVLGLALALAIIGRRPKARAR